MRITTALPGLALVAVATLGAGPAHAAPTGPACGDTLTVDTVLTADLTCAEGVGLRLGPGVTLDLDGHVLRGGSLRQTGVVVPAGGDVTITDGVITFWGAAVADHVYDGDPDVGAPGPLGGTVHLDRVVVRDGLYGVRTVAHEDGSATTVDVDRSTFSLVTAPLWIDGGVLELRRSTLRDNGSAIALQGGRATITRSVLRSNDGAVNVSEGGSAVVRSTAFLGNAAAVETWSGGSADVRRSEIRDSTTAVRLNAGSGSTVVTDVSITGGSRGIQAEGGTLVVERVHLADHTDESVVLFAPPAGQVASARIVASTFHDGGDGVVSAWGAGLSLGGSTATGNAGWGVHAPGALDLGGNAAGGNGLDPQCVGVVCAAAP